MLKVRMYLLSMVCLFNGVGVSSETAQPPSWRLLVAEISETDATDFRQATYREKLDILKSKGYRIVQEREVAYAIPPTYFKHLSDLTNLLSTVSLFQEYEMSTIPEETLSLIRQTAQSYNSSPSDFSGVTCSVAVVAVVETKQAVCQVDILPARADKHQHAAFFAGSLESWREVVHTYTGQSVEVPREILGDLIRGLPNDAQKRQSSVRVSLKGDVNASRDTQTIVLFSQAVPARRLSEEDRAYFLGRYYQLVQREIANEHAQWSKVWQRAFQQVLGENPDWKGWQANVWEGSWEQLPTDIRQKLITSLQAEGLTDDLQGSFWRIEVIPYIGFFRRYDIGTYSEWFPAKNDFVR